MNKNQSNSTDKYFGDPKRLQEYQILFYLGLIMMLIGIPFLFLSENWIILGVILLFMGSICLVAGFLGKKEEIKKTGMKRISTETGKAALFLGVLSVFFSNIGLVPLILGGIAIILSIKSIRNGDNEYSLSGGIAGVIGVMVNLYVTVLFTFF